MLLALHGLTRGLAQTVGVHHDTLAISADHQELALIRARLRRCQRLCIKGIEILAQVYRHLLGLAFRDLSATSARQMIYHLIERSPNDLFHPGIAIGQAGYDAIEQ